MIVKVYDALSDGNKAKMIKQPLPKMVDIVFKLCEVNKKWHQVKKLVIYLD